MEELEKKLIELQPQIEGTKTASELYSEDYEPKHRTMRKRVGCFEVCYRQAPSGNVFEFAAITKLN